MPHLAHCLASPSPSGTTSPVPAAATTPAAEAVAPPTDQHGDQRASPGGDCDGDGDGGFDAAELVETVGFYCGMFPQLKSSVRACCSRGAGRLAAAGRTAAASLRVAARVAQHRRRALQLAMPSAHVPCSACC